MPRSGHVRSVHGARPIPTGRSDSSPSPGTRLCRFAAQARRALFSLRREIIATAGRESDSGTGCPSGPCRLTTLPCRQGPTPPPAAGRRTTALRAQRVRVGPGGGEPGPAARTPRVTRAGAATAAREALLLPRASCVRTRVAGRGIASCARGESLACGRARRTFEPGSRVAASLRAGPGVTQSVMRRAAVPCADWARVRAFRSESPAPPPRGPGCAAPITRPGSSCRVPLADPHRAGPDPRSRPRDVTSKRGELEARLVPRLVPLVISTP